jgi:hypothetical protein
VIFPTRPTDCLLIVNVAVSQPGGQIQSNLLGLSLLLT